MLYDWSMESNHTTLILYSVYFAKQNLIGDDEKEKVPKPARIPPQTPPAGGKTAEAGANPKPQKNSLSCRVRIVSASFIRIFCKMGSDFFKQTPP